MSEDREKIWIKGGSQEISENREKTWIKNRCYVCFQFV